MVGTKALKDSAQSCQFWTLRHYLNIGIFRWKGIKPREPGWGPVECAEPQPFHGD